jgi:hypothetical protein
MIHDVSTHCMLDSGDRGPSGSWKLKGLLCAPPHWVYGGVIRVGLAYVMLLLAWHDFRVCRPYLAATGH